MPMLVEQNSDFSAILLTFVKTETATRCKCKYFLEAHNFLSPLRAQTICIKILCMCCERYANLRYECIFLTSFGRGKRNW